MKTLTYLTKGRIIQEKVFIQVFQCETEAAVRRCSSK